MYPETLYSSIRDYTLNDTKIPNIGLSGLSFLHLTLGLGSRVESSGLIEVVP